MGDYNDGAAVIMGEGAEYVDDVAGIGGIQIARGLVGENYFASLSESARDRHALLLTARKVAGQTLIVCCGELHALADFMSQRRRIFFGHFLQIERVHNIFLHGQKWEKIVILIDHADGIAAQAVSVPILC